MSAPRELDCQEAAKRLHELLDQELTADVEEAVRRHLAMCARCMAVYEFEEAFKRFVTAKARSPRAPENLRRDILALIDEETRATEG